MELLLRSSEVGLLRSAIKIPANAGPRMRDRLNCVALSASADAILSRGTIDWNEGIDSASVTPIISESETTIQGRTASLSSSPTRSNGQSIWID